MKLINRLKGKLHQARVTYANPEYVGSVAIDRTLMERVGIEEGELVHIWAIDHTARIQTYAFAGKDGEIGINGGAALQFRPGDRVVIAAFVMTDEPYEPRSVLLDESNRIVSDLSPFVASGIQEALA